MAILAQSAPQLLENPCCDFINEIPWWIFLIIHISLFLIGAFYASKSFGAGESTFGWGFTLYALGEVLYMTYHVNITNFLFAHTIAEVFMGLGIIMLFTAAVRKGAIGTKMGANR